MGSGDSVRESGRPTDLGQNIPRGAVPSSSAMGTHLRLHRGLVSAEQAACWDLGVKMEHIGQGRSLPKGRMVSSRVTADIYI